jgi:hypothetical protein
VRESPSFYGSTASGGAKNRRISGLVGVLLVAFLGVAVAKPWGGSPPAPASTATPSAPDTEVVPLSSPAVIVTEGPLPVAFTTTAPPAASATWSGLRWRQLEPGDPFSLVTSVVPWRAGFVALGWQAAPPATPVWTSADGTSWDPLPFNTPTTFWLGQTVLGVAQMGNDLVALTEVAQWCGEPCAPTYILPVVSWTSTDGRRWEPSMLPQSWLVDPPGISPLVAFGPGGLVIATRGENARVATSTDGTHWQLLPKSAFPGQFALNDLRATAAGYVAAGAWITNDRPSVAASLWSADGRHWAARPTLLASAPALAPDVGSAITSLAAGRNGLIAVGRDAASPSGTHWWQSMDGRAWQPLQTFSPLRPVVCAREGCTPEPNGALVGDGQQLVALVGGSAAAAWLSTDGRSWRPLALFGDFPGDSLARASVLPSGILASDGATTWFGEAITR